MTGKEFKKYINKQIKDKEIIQSYQVNIYTEEARIEQVDLFNQKINMITNLKFFNKDTGIEGSIGFYSIGEGTQNPYNFEKIKNWSFFETKK